MSWWFSFKNLYGLVMGTSTDWMKPASRPHWPTAFYPLGDDLQVFLGGTGNCGLLQGPAGTLLINCGSSPSSESLFQHLKEQKSGNYVLIGLASSKDCIGSMDLGHWDHVFLPDVTHGRVSLTDPIEPSGKILEIETKVNETTGEAKKTETKISDPKVAEAKMVRVSQPLSFSWGGEKVHVFPMCRGKSETSLVVALENHKVLFSGPLVFNRIHPPLPSTPHWEVNSWIESLSSLQENTVFQNLQWVVPQEGDIGDKSLIPQFVDYIKDLSDPDVEFSFCREHYDWMEVAGYTSLEENFQKMRSRFSSIGKNH